MPNEWVDTERAASYLERRSAIPHLDDGYENVLAIVPSTADRILDLGAGDGHLLSLLRVGRPDTECVAVDFSAHMVEAARSRFAADDDVEVIEHDLAASLPALGSFDVVVSSYAIHHLEHSRKRDLYAEVFDLLEPGALFCNLEHVASPTTELHERFFDAIGERPEDEDPSNKLLDVETQLEWLREIGFDNVECLWKWRELALLIGEKH